MAKVTHMWVFKLKKMALDVHQEATDATNLEAEWDGRCLR